MKNTFVIKVAYGGLGDHLFYSPLPRIAKESGYSRVLISTRSEFRHPAYKRLIWEKNPYVDGFTDEDAPTVLLGTVPSCMNILDATMIRRGLDDGIRFHEPELYYEPALLPELQEATVFDPNFVSYVGRVSTADVESFFEARGIVPDYMLKLREKSLAVRRYRAILETRSFEDYCSVIRSAKQFICVTSGGATLAAALRRPSIALWGAGQNPIFHHSPIHTYVNVHPSFGQQYWPVLHRSLSNTWWSLKAKASEVISERRKA